MREDVPALFPDKGLTDAAAEAALARIIDPGFRKRVETIVARAGVGLAEACHTHIEERRAAGFGPRGIECFYDAGDRALVEFVTVPRGTDEHAHRAVVRPDANHCLLIHEVDGKWRGTMVRRIDAARDALPALPGRLVARLQIDDLVELEGQMDGRPARGYWRVRSIVGDGLIRLWPASLARRSSPDLWKRYGFSSRQGWELSSADALRKRTAKFLRTSVLGRVRGKLT